jgi:cobalt-zinc-cadmium resistance protein CzcA
MVRALIDFSLEHRFVVVIAWLLIALFGLRSLDELPIDAVPDVTNVQVQVMTNAPGLAPQEVERFITVPVERAVSGLPRVEELRSVTKFGLSVVTVVFEEGTDIYFARQLISERMSAARDEIPEGYGTPTLGPISTGLGEVYQFEVRGEGYTPMQLREILDWNVNYHLRSVPGVIEVGPFGGELKTYQATLDPAKLVAFEISVSEVYEAIERNNKNVGGGYIAHAGEQYLIRGEGLISSLEDLGRIPVAKRADGTPIYIEQLGSVEFAPLIRLGAVTRDGDREAVIGIVMMLMGANSRTVAADVHEKVQEIAKTLPEGVTIDTFYNRTELVDSTISTVLGNLLEGGVLVLIVLLLLLGSIKGGLIVALAIPLSMMVAVILMRWTGISGNLMSLGAIDFGIIVDGAVVIIENIVRKLKKRKSETDVPHIEKVRQACYEVGKPVLFAIGIIIIVYLPILALRGIEGKMFRPMALTVVFALIGSLLCAFTLMPVLATYFLKNVREKEPILFRLCRSAYEPILKLVMKRPVLTTGGAAATFGIALFIAPFLGAEFIPRLDEGSMAIQVWRLPSISLEKSNEISLEVEKALKRFPEIKSVVSRTGTAEIATDPMGVEISDQIISLQPRDTWRFDSKEELIEAIDEVLKAEFPSIQYSFTQPIELRVSELVSGVRSDVGIGIFANTDSLQEMKEVADRVAAAVSKVPGMVEVKTEQIVGLPSIRIQVDREKAARLGIDTQSVLDVVEALGGKELGRVLEGQKSFRLQARFKESARNDIHGLGELLVPVGIENKVKIPLKEIATIELESGPAQISRENIARKISVEANVRGRDLASAVAEAKERVAAEAALPPGWSIAWGGQFENLEEAAKRLTVVVPVALLLIFALLLTTFASKRLAGLIFLNVPLALTGGILSLWIRGYPFSISAAVGFIALFGIAVLNGVVLISYIVQEREKGVDKITSSMQAARMRLRPVLMTALTDIIGFVPMALATSAGAEVQRPLATVVIGGLITSTMLTLLVLPSLYRWFDPYGAKTQP